MSLTDSNGGGLSAADVAAVTGNNGGFGFGNGDGAWWLLVLFLFAFGGGWNNNGFGGNGGGMVNADIQRGFDQTAVMSGLNGINTALVGGFADASIAQCNQSMNFLTALNGVQGAA